MAVANREKKIQHIQAYARLRPFNNQENDCNARKCMEIVGKDIIIPNAHGSKRYCFDKVFGIESKQKDVYMTVIQPIIQEVMQGYNCTVFAYGQTGTGKTYTMVGEQTSPELSYLEDSHAGIIPRTLGHLFESLNLNTDLDFTVRVSYLELYNEVLIDLLGNDDNKSLRIYEDPRSKGSVQIHGLEEVTVYDKNQVYQILQVGSEKKITASTFMNAQSSRSHTVFTITLHSRETTPEGEELVKTGKLNLVDLAGSENISRSGAVDKRAREAGNINQSLLTLGRVIKALVDKCSHIPYRESKLTRILQDSLGGKTKTTIIATVSPASNNLDESISTLDYAYRARNITNRPEVNQRMSKTQLINRYLEEIDRLKKDVIAARTQEGIYLNPDNYDMILRESEKRKEDLMKSVEECSAFESRVQELERWRIELEEVCSVKSNELKQAAMDIEMAKNNLKKLRKQRKIHQALIDKYDEAQTILRQTTDDLSEALDEYISDQNKLFDKVDNLYDVIEINRFSAQELLDSISEHDNVVLDKIGTLKETIITSFEKLKDDMLHFTNDQHDFYKKFENKFKTMQNNVQIKVKSQLEYLLTEQKISKTSAECLQSIFEKHNGEFNTFYMELKQEFHSYGHASKGDQDSFTALQEDMKVNIKKSVSEIEERVKLLCDTSNQAMKELKNEIQSLNESLLMHEENINLQEVMVTKEMEKFCTEFIGHFNENMNKHKKTVNSCVVSMKKSIHAPQKNLDKIFEKHRQAEIVLEKNVLLTEERCKTTKLVFEHHSDALQEMNRELFEASKERLEKLYKNIQILKEKSDNYQLVINTSDQILLDQKQRSDIAIEKLSNLAVDIEKYEHNYIQTLSVADDHITKNSHEIINEIQGVLDDCDTGGQDLCDEIIKIKELIDDYGDSQIVPEHMGDTPARREKIKYIIPKKISKSILKNYPCFDESVTTLTDESLIDIPMSDLEEVPTSDLEEVPTSDLEEVPTSDLKEVPKDSSFS